MEQNVAAIDHFSISRDTVSLEDLTEEVKTSFKTSFKIQPAMSFSHVEGHFRAVTGVRPTAAAPNFPVFEQGQRQGQRRKEVAWKWLAVGFCL